jgi:hypothetical protein
LLFDNGFEMRTRPPPLGGRVDGKKMLPAMKSMEREAAWRGVRVSPMRCVRTSFCRTYSL